MAEFTQSTVPGCRTPHLWLRDGRSLYDGIGPDFALLRLDPAVEVGGLVAAACRWRSWTSTRTKRLRSIRTSCCFRAPIGTWPGEAIDRRMIRWR